MSTLYLIRHGQASFGSENYDQLSPLGQQQALWLGEYFKARNIRPSRLIRGDLQRHRQTANAIEQGLALDIDHDENRHWNEFDFHAIGQQYLLAHPDKVPQQKTVKNFFSVLKQGLLAWSRNEIEGELPETWLEFQHRITRALKSVTENNAHETVVVVSSGGAISMALQVLMGFSPETTINLNLQTRNTGVSEIFFNAHQAYVTSFNTLPHLSQPERVKAITSA